MEKVNNNITLASSDMSNNEREVDQDEAKFQEERALLASLIENMKLEIDESKRINKQLKKANTSLGKELERYQDMKCVKDVEFDCAKAYGLLEEHRINSEKSLDAYKLKEELKQFYKQQEDNDIEKIIDIDELNKAMSTCLQVIQADTWIVPDHHTVKRVIELQLAPTV
ncbi:hypothetical protein Tco_1046198 [Tanacetum coccineum]